MQTSGCSRATSTFSDRKQCREAHINVSDRKVKNDATESRESGGKTRLSDATTKGLQQCGIPMDVGAWPVDGGQGALIRPGRIRGSLHTEQAVALRQRKPLDGRLREAKAGFGNREVKPRRRKPSRVESGAGPEVATTQVVTKRQWVSGNVWMDTRRTKPLEQSGGFCCFSPKTPVIRRSL